MNKTVTWNIFSETMTVFIQKMRDIIGMPYYSFTINIQSPNHTQRFFLPFLRATSNSTKHISFQKKSGMRYLQEVVSSIKLQVNN